MSELYTLRWGDAEQFTTKGFTVPMEGTTQTRFTKQLVSANWRVPMSWNVLLFAFPQINTGDNGTYTVNWLVTLGAGQSTGTEVPLFSMGPLSKTSGLVQQQQLVPSQNLQIRAQIVVNVIIDQSVPSSILLGAFVAPNNAEVGAEEVIARAISGEPPTDEGEMRFMPMGFYGDLDPLHYKQNRR